MQLQSRLAVLLVLVAGVLPAVRAAALPRYSARYGQRCGLCHVNPSGGGLRTAYATRFIVPDEIAWRPAGQESLYLPDPQITSSLLVGADFREVYAGSGERARNLDFFQMQGDLYLDFQLDPHSALYYDRGMSGSSELFALGYWLPFTGYVKAGRFVPSYGWKLDDHTMYVRDELGLAPPANSDVGVELGFQPGRFDVQLGLLNGSRGAALDTDNRLAQSASVAWRGGASDLTWAVGASGYHRGGARQDLDTAGGYGCLSWRGITWIGESDVARTRTHGAGHVTALVTSHELSVPVHQGLDLLATYDFFDPDRNLESGARSRWGVGVYAMPRPFVVLDARYRRTDVRSGPAVTGHDFDETVLQLHVTY